MAEKDAGEVTLGDAVCACLMAPFDNPNNASIHNPNCQATSVCFTGMHENQYCGDPKSTVASRRIRLKKGTSIGSSQIRLGPMGKFRWFIWISACPCAAHVCFTFAACSLWPIRWRQIKGYQGLLPKPGAPIVIRMVMASMTLPGLVAVSQCKQSWTTLCKLVVASVVGWNLHAKINIYRRLLESSRHPKEFLEDFLKTAADKQRGAGNLMFWHLVLSQRVLGQMFWKHAVVGTKAKSLDTGARLRRWGTGCSSGFGAEVAHGQCFFSFL